MKAFGEFHDRAFPSFTTDYVALTIMFQRNAELNALAVRLACITHNRSMLHALYGFSLFSCFLFTLCCLQLVSIVFR